MARLGAREERPALNKQLAARDDQQRVRFLLLSCHHVPQLSERHQQPCVASVRTRPPGHRLCAAVHVRLGPQRHAPWVSVMGRSATAKLAACCTPGLYAAFGCQVSSCVLHAVCHAARCMLRITLNVARRTPLVSCGMFDAKCRPGHTRE